MEEKGCCTKLITISYLQQQLRKSNQINLSNREFPCSPQNCRGTASFRVPLVLSPHMLVAMLRSVSYSPVPEVSPRPHWAFWHGVPLVAACGHRVLSHHWCCCQR